MNEIESPVRARILEVLVEDAQPVEYGQPPVFNRKNLDGAAEV